MQVSSTELKTHLGEYLGLVSKEDIQITLHGKVAAILKRPIDQKLKALDDLVGILPHDVDLEKDRKERLANQ